MVGILSQALSLPYSEHRTLADDVGARDFYVTITDISGKGVTTASGPDWENTMDDNFFERNNVRCDRCAPTHPAPDNAPPPPHWAFVMIDFQYGAGSSLERDRSLETPTSLSHRFFRDNLEGDDALLLCDRCLASWVEWYRCMRSAPEWYRDMRSAP